MVAFYEGLIRGYDKATAMAGAKRAMMEQTRDPFYWAPFVVVGDSRVSTFMKACRGNRSPT